MIELFQQNEKLQNRNSSKGNQLKWENDGIWYKADYTGYEGLSEYMISQLLSQSTLKEKEFVLYDLEQIRYHKMIYNGAKSQDFLQGDWQIITLERLFHSMYGKRLSESIWKIHDLTERLLFLTNQVEKITGLKDFGIYMNQLFTIDALFLNEDRHMHNIAVLMNEDGDFAYSPVFDHGAGLLSDTTMDYPMGEDVYSLIKEVKAKTISRDFDEQLDVSENLYGYNLKFSFTKKDVSRLLNNAKIYDAAIRKRVETIMFIQMEKYAYLF